MRSRRLERGLAAAGERSGPDQPLAQALHLLHGEPRVVEVSRRSAGVVAQPGENGDHGRVRGLGETLP